MKKIVSMLLALIMVLGMAACGAAPAPAATEAPAPVATEAPAPAPVKKVGLFGRLFGKK